jgi:hypothetical protein
VHLAHIGLPLAIDPLYNPPRQRATFEHPDGRKLSVTCDLPRDFRATLSQLGKIR